jgi:predicted metalloprotease with PDZ domain
MNRTFHLQRPARRPLILALALCCATSARGADLPRPEDKPYPGAIELAVDLADAPRRIFRVHESMPAKAGPLVLLYPEWIPGEHAPTGTLDGVAGLRISADGRRLSWRRDLEHPFALNLEVPPGVDRIDVEFQFLSPTDGGRFGSGVSATARLVELEWNQVVLYPAGFFARRLMVHPSVSLPEGWSFASALEPFGPADGATTRFDAVSLETLVDSPLIAGRNFKRVDISEQGAPPVHLDFVADRAADLAASQQQVQQQQALARQAHALFGARHYRHYDFLVTLSDQTVHFGLEHHQSSDDRTTAEFLTSPDQYVAFAGLLPHEYVHSWNGKHRRPAGLVTANFNEPYRDDLLWVYEGLTTYYGDVLTARSGMWTAEQYRDHLAVVASRMSHVPGRSWRPLQDTADDAARVYRAPGAWRNWRRGADFYEEGSLIWLDVDTTIREESRGERSLDDFARAFFGGSDDAPLTPVAYSFDDVVAALQRVQKHDWRGFLTERLQSTAAAPLGGLGRAGWKLVYAEEPGEYSKASEKARKMIDLTASAGFVAGKGDDSVQAPPDAVIDVLWGGPAFDAGLVPGMRIVAVDGDRYSAEVLKDAIKAAKDTTRPIELLVEYAGSFLTLKLDYHGGMRYPRLERIENSEDRLSAIGRPK